MVLYTSCMYTADSCTRSPLGCTRTDVALLYQRALAEVHLRGSASVGSADSADLESLCSGWAQPATFR